jgi:hypothetical protein
MAGQNRARRLAPHPASHVIEIDGHLGCVIDERDEAVLPRRPRALPNQRNVFLLAFLLHLRDGGVQGGYPRVHLAGEGTTGQHRIGRRPAAEQLAVTAQELTARRVFVATAAG